MKYDILICIAMDQEAESFLNKYKPDFVQNFGCAKLYSLLSDKRIAILITGMGKFNSTCALTWFLATSEVDLVFNIGLAGTPDTFIDVGSFVEPHTFGELDHVSSLISIPTVGYSDSIKGSCLTGDMLCTETDDYIRNVATVVDMESYCIVKVSLLFGKRVSVLKMISDYCDSDSHKIFDDTLLSIYSSILCSKIERIFNLM